MNEYVIELRGDRRSDGTVCIFSPDLPLFNVIGPNEREALDTAQKVLPEYLKANVPEFVNLRAVPSANEAITRVASGLLPAHMIATMNARDDGPSPA